MENRAFNMDCLEAMREMPDLFFDLAVIDPPYGIGENGSKAASRRKLASTVEYEPFEGQDKEPPPAEYFKELVRVSKNQIIFGANHFISRIPPPADTPCWIVWDKQNGGSDFADFEMAWTSFCRAARIFRFRWAGMLQGNMKNKETRIHPTQKPVALYAWIFEKFAKPGDWILDTHLGSGSSRIAAWDAGMNFMGYEKHKGYFEAQEKRFQQHTAQLSLFGGGGYMITVLIPYKIAARVAERRNPWT